LYLLLTQYIIRIASKNTTTKDPRIFQKNLFFSKVLLNKSTIQVENSTVFTELEFKNPTMLDSSLSV
jgi:hypothetical protein